MGSFCYDIDKSRHLFNHLLERKKTSQCLQSVRSVFEQYSSNFPHSVLHPIGIVWSLLHNQIGRLGGVHLGNTFNVETKKYFPGYRWFHIFLYWGRCGRNSHEAPFFLGAFLIWQFNRKTTILLNNNSSMKTNQVHIWFLIAVCSWQAMFNFRKCWKTSDFLIQRLSIDQDTTRDKIVMKRKASISRNIKRQFSLSFNIFYDLALCL